MPRVILHLGMRPWVFFVFSVLLNFQASALEYAPLGKSEASEFHFFQSNPYLLYHTEIQSLDPLPWIKSDFNEFESLNNRALNMGPSENYYWMLFPLKNESNETKNFFVTLKNSAINQIRYYYIKNKEVIDSGITGDNFAFQSRPYQFCNFSFPIQLKAGEEMCLLLELDKRNENFFCAFDVSDEGEFHQMEIRVYLIFGVFVGLLLLSILLNLVLYVGIKDKVHLIYSLYALSNLLLILAYDGLDFQFIYPDNPFISNISRYVTTSMTYILLFSLLKIFVFEDKMKVRINRLKMAFQFAHLLVIFSSILIFKFADDSAWQKIVLFRFLSVLSLSSMIVLIILAYGRSREGSKQAQLFLLAVTILFLGAIEYTLNINGWITHLFLFNIAIPGNLQLFIVIEVVLVFIAIAFRFKKIRDESLLMSYQLILAESKKKDEEIALIFNERKRISADLHDGIGSILFGVRMKIQTYLQSHDRSRLDLEAVSNDLNIMSSSLRRVVWRLQEDRPFDLILNDLLGKAQFIFTQKGVEFKTKINLNSTFVFKEEFKRDFKFLFLEILSNASKYSNASEFTCHIEVTNSDLNFLWLDSGTDTADRRAGGFGLMNIAGRIKNWNALRNEGAHPFDYNIQFSLEMISEV